MTAPRYAATIPERRAPESPAERLFTTCMRLPRQVLPDPLALNGDAVMLAPAAGQAMVARGSAHSVAAATPAALAEHYEALVRHWDVDGAGAAPRALFTFPFAASGEAGRLWVPRVAIHYQGDDATVVLTTVANAPYDESWGDDIGRLFTPRPAPAASGEPIRAERIGMAAEPACWQDKVAAATEAIGRGLFDKVVLTRRVDFALSRPADPRRVLAGLADHYPHCTVFALPQGKATMVAASPERLAVKSGEYVLSDALAGTCGRGGSADRDDQLAAALLACPKERGEHALVVTAIARALDDLCRTVEHAAEPSVMRLRLLQHLHTVVRGRLHPGAHLLDVVARLHPTPAVSGWPRQAALDWLERMGDHRDSWYTGAAGWIDTAGDGSASVVLRCALLQDCRAALWAGAGIVAGSKPAAELAETETKLATMLEVLRQG